MNSQVPQYRIEENEILRKAYQLLADFFANQQIARIVHPDIRSHPLKDLEGRFLHKEISSLLLEVAILFRSLDEQLKKSANQAQRDDYLLRLKITNTHYGFDMFESLPIRECCNKIIHATTFDPIEVEGRDAHTQDGGAYWEGDKPEIMWRHLSGVIRISGDHNSKKWAYLISIPEFVEALAYLLGSPIGRTIAPINKGV